MKTAIELLKETFNPNHDIWASTTSQTVAMLMKVYHSQFSQPSDVSDEEIEKRFPINVSMIRPCNLSTRNKWIQQGIMWYKSKAMRDGQIKPTIEGEEDSSDGHMAMYGG